MSKTNPYQNISLHAARTIAAAAEKKADELGVDVVIAVADSGAHLLYLQRMDNAFVTSVDIAINKAFTAAALKQGTHSLAECVKPGDSLYGLQLSNDQRIVPFGGGFPLKNNSEIVGAIGVSGGTVEQDMSIAQAAIESFNFL